jgi:hypothetical protein
VTSCEKKQQILTIAAKALSKSIGIPYNPEEDPKAFIHKILNLFTNPNKEKCEECKICRREEK